MSAITAERDAIPKPFVEYGGGEGGASGELRKEQEAWPGRNQAERELGAVQLRSISATAGQGIDFTFFGMRSLDCNPECITRGVALYQSADGGHTFSFVEIRNRD